MSMETTTAILGNVSLTIASVVAIFGIDAWRREHVGKRRMELAEEVLALFYQVQDVIREIRSPFGYGGEGSSRKGNPSETPQEKATLDNAHVVIERYMKHSEFFSKIHAVRYRFQAQFGREKTKPFEDLNGVIKDIVMASRQLGRYWSDRSPRTDQQQEEHRKKVQKLEAIFWEGGGEDVTQPKVEALIAEMEKTCRDTLLSKGTLFGIINLPLRSKS